MASEPKTLQEAILYFADPKHCREYLVARRWPNGVICPRCGSDKVAFMEKYNRWQCNSKTHANRQFTSKTGTIFEDSPLGLDKWLAAMWLLTNCKNGISSYEVSRDLDISQKSAWHMMHRIRLAMQDDLTGGTLSGEIEIDETFIGGKARNMHRIRRNKVNMQANNKGKTLVLGILQRETEGKPKKIRAAVIPDRSKPTIREHLIPTVEKGSTLYSDEAGKLWSMEGFTHEIINHAETYVRDNVHTNTLENFWSLLKRGINGSYVSVEPFHLFRYVDEQAFRFNNRKDMNDSDRFDLVVRQILGKRLTWAEVTGKVMETKPPTLN
jgi:hypothetical protein